MSGIANSSVSSGAAVQQGAPQNGNGSQGSKVCDRPGCTGHGFYEEKRSWKTWFWGQDHLPTYNAQKNGVTKTEEPAPVDLMATNVPLTVGMSVTLGGRNVGAEAEEMMEQLLDTTQTSLGAASFLPGIGDAIDLLNAGISYLRGNYGDVVAYAAASWIPFVTGAVVKKGADALGDVTKKADEIAEVAKNLIPEGNLANHLFKGIGKLADTPYNRALIQSISNGTPLGVDQYGKIWYVGVDAGGRPIYSYAQNGIVKGAGYMDMTIEEMITRYKLIKVQ